MVVRCELCDELSSERSIRCDCGYDFRTGEVTAAVEGAEREFEVARRRIGRGLVIAGNGVHDGALRGFVLVPAP